MRYKRHYYTATGRINEPIKAEFLQHAQEEEDHAGRIAERIVQLNGEPDFNPSTISQRSHAEYDECTDIKGMNKANLIAERVAIASYRQIDRKSAMSGKSVNVRDGRGSGRRIKKKQQKNKKQ